MAWKSLAGQVRNEARKARLSIISFYGTARHWRLRPPTNKFVGGGEANSSPALAAPAVAPWQGSPAAGDALWSVAQFRATCNHQTNSMSHTNGFVEIKAARVVWQARLQPLKRGWEGPKNLGTVASTKSHSVSTEPVFEVSRPSCGLQGAAGSQGGPGPLKVRCHQSSPFGPIGDERAEGGSFFRRIRRVARRQLQLDCRSRHEIWLANRPLRGPPDPWIRSPPASSRSVVADEQRSRRNVPENVLSIP